MNEVLRECSFILLRTLLFSSFIFVMNELLHRFELVVRECYVLMIEVDADTLSALHFFSAFEGSDDVCVEGAIRLMFDDFDLIDLLRLFELLDRPEARKRNVHPLPFLRRAYSKEGIEI